MEPQHRTAPTATGTSTRAIRLVLRRAAASSGTRLSDTERVRRILLRARRAIHTTSLRVRSLPLRAGHHRAQRRVIRPQGRLLHGQGKFLRRPVPSRRCPRPVSRSDDRRDNFCPRYVPGEELAGPSRGSLGEAYLGRRLDHHRRTHRHRLGEALPALRIRRSPRSRRWKEPSCGKLTATPISARSAQWYNRSLSRSEGVAVHRSTRLGGRDGHGPAPVGVSQRNHRLTNLTTPPPRRAIHSRRVY